MSGHETGDCGCSRRKEKIKQAFRYVTIKGRLVKQLIGPVTKK